MLLHELSGVPLPRDIDQRRNALDDYLQSSQHTEGTDPSVRDFNAAYAQAWKTEPVIAELSDIVLSKHKKLDMQYVSEFLPRAMVALMLRFDADHLYATGDITPALEKLQSSDEAQFYMSLNIGRPIQSNIGTREWFLNWVLQAHGLTDDRPIVEYGTSGQAIGIRSTEIASGRLEHHTVQMMDRRRIGVANRLVHNPAMTALMHEIIGQPMPVPRWYGLDLFSPHDHTVRQWVRACSQYLSDWTDPSKRAAFDYLQSKQPDNVRWNMEDFSTFDSRTYDAIYPGEAMPRAVYIPFSIYELESDKARTQTLNQAIDLVSQPGNPNSGGVVAVLDDIQSISGDNHIKIAARRRDFSTCGGWVYHTNMPEAGFQKYFSFENGRLGRAIPESGVALSALQAVRNRHST